MLRVNSAKQPVGDLSGCRKFYPGHRVQPMGAAPFAMIDPYGALGQIGAGIFFYRQQTGKGTFDFFDREVQTWCGTVEIIQKVRQLFFGRFRLSAVIFPGCMPRACQQLPFPR